MVSATPSPPPLPHAACLPSPTHPLHPFIMSASASPLPFVSISYYYVPYSCVLVAPFPTRESPKNWACLPTLQHFVRALEGPCFPLSKVRNWIRCSLRFHTTLTRTCSQASREIEASLRLLGSPRWIRKGPHRFKSTSLRDSATALRTCSPESCREGPGTDSGFSLGGRLFCSRPLCSAESPRERFRSRA